ncbi:MAG: GAF domain-containing protein [Rhodothermales bacterium]|nr:GAF domain-containing protein [Rhodothermales bacterium]
MSAVFPWATIDRHIAAAIVPFELIPFYSTPAFKELDLLKTFDPERNPACEVSSSEMAVTRTMKAYHLILSRLYGAPRDFYQPFVLGQEDAETGLSRYFQIEMDARFVQVKVRGQKPHLEAATIEALRDDPMNLDLWRSHLPPERFELVGFAIVRATEVTFQHVLSLIKNDLLDHRDFTENHRLDRLQGHLRSLLEKPDLEIGVMALETDRIEELASSKVIGRSLVLSDNHLPECPRMKASAYARAIRTGTPIFISDLEASDDLTGLEWHVHDLGYRSMAVIPLMEAGQLVGLLELVSRQERQLAARDYFRLREVSALLATALKRILEEREHRIQAHVKRRYTAIHPVVEWRFRQAALKQMNDPGQASADAIVFDDVYPLYGLSDIRNSSVFRAESIKEDLVEQLGLALAVIIQASSHTPQPALDELGFRLGKHIDHVTDGVSVGDESEPLEVLAKEVEPLFDKFAALDPAVRKSVEDYRAAIDPELGVVYRKRKAFEDSITTVNERLSDFLEAREELAQGLAPHYFEKYRTDGVDYNIYVGEALNPSRAFDHLDLRNLRLWQLITMAGCALDMRDLKVELPLPLDVTHLILVQSQPLSIRFRPDEKKFDVDGAYNIRYEIVKKRIDKATIRGTQERLTQPGKIAIAYSLLSEQREYERYIDYLTEAGYLKAGIEYLDLEPLQGVQGLRAMRVTVEDNLPQFDFLTEVLPAQVSLPGS